MRSPDRREVLALAGAAFLAPCGSSAVPLDDGRGGDGRPISKAVKLGMVAGGGSLLEKLRLLAELGFDGVEVDAPSDIDARELLAARAATGVEIHGVVDSVHWKHPLSDPDPEVRAAGIAGLRAALRDAKVYGASTVLLVPAVVTRTSDYASAYARSQEAIREVLPLAEELGVSLALENVWNGFLLSPLEAARYVDELGSDRVGWYLDVGNLVNFGWPEHWVRVLGPRILKLDVKEFSRKKRDDEGLWKGFDVEIGDGDCDWPAVMAALDEVGFRGWATAEVRGGDRTRLAEIARRMDDVLAR